MFENRPQFAPRGEVFRDYDLFLADFGPESQP